MYFARCKTNQRKECEREIGNEQEMDLTFRSGIHSTLLIIGPANREQIERTNRNDEMGRKKNQPHIKTKQKMYTPRPDNAIEQHNLHGNCI